MLNNGDFLTNNYSLVLNATMVNLIIKPFTPSDVKSLSYQVDKIAPSDIKGSYEVNEWYQLFNEVTFGLFFDDTVTVTLTATDATSGVKDFTYTLSGETAKTTSGTFQVSSEFLGHISVSATDNAGNQSESVAFENFAVDS